MNTRYTLASDDDGHKFIIPADKREEWEEYLRKIYELDEYGGEPEWAVMVNPSCVTFENWKED
jgi:hypothetical protein